MKRFNKIFAVCLTLSVLGGFSSSVSVGLVAGFTEPVLLKYRQRGEPLRLTPAWCINHHATCQRYSIRWQFYMYDLFHRNTGARLNIQLMPSQHFSNGIKTRFRPATTGSVDVPLRLHQYTNYITIPKMDAQLYTLPILWSYCNAFRSCSCCCVSAGFLSFWMDV